MASAVSSPPHVPLPVSIIETYSLISDNSVNENGSSPSSGSPRLSAFVVRLTDASLKALNQAVAEAKQKKAKGGPLCGYVELGNRGDGTLCFGGGSSQVQRFSLADAQRDLGPKGQLDVIEQQPISDASRSGFNKSSTCGTMKLIGPVTHRVQISATTEDTFEKTKQKAQQANEEMKRTAAKVALKGPAGAGGANKVWQKISNAKASTSQRPITPLSHQHQKSAALNKGSSGNPGSNSGAGDITKRPLRQRILYKLLPNPMTAVDLLSKLTGEGLTDYERSIFDRTLNEVAQVSRPADCSSGNADALCPYELKRSAYSDIRLDDWPFYTNWERQQCRKRMVMVKNPAAQQQHHSNSGSSANGTSYSNSDDTTRRVSGKISYRPPPKKPAANDSPKTVPSNNVSPPMPPTAPSLSSPPSSTASPAANGSGMHSNGDDTTQRASVKTSYRPPVKRPAASPLTSKSPPIAPAPLPSPPRPASTTTSPTTAMASAYSPPPKKKAHKDSDAPPRPTSPVERPAPVNGSNGHDFDDDPNLRRKRRQQHQQRPALAVSNNLGNANGHVVERNHTAPAPIPPTPAPDPPDDNGCWTNSHPSVADYRSEYPAITSADDRRRYKDDFDREYPTYLKLYERLRLTAAEFEKLGDKLKRTSKETQEYKEIESEIFSKYRQFQQDTDMHQSRKEHERLRKKLGIIKERVKEYDDRQLMVTDWDHGVA